MPDAVNVDPTQNQLDTVSGNTASFSAAKDLAQQYNDFMANQVAARLKKNFPQFEGLQDAGAQDIADLLAGKLSTSDAAASQRSSAARALGVGGNVAATTLADLGISQQRARLAGLSALPSFTSTVLGAKAAPMFDFSNVFLSPQQRWQQTYTNKVNAWNVQNLRNQMAVQPAPWAKALAGFGDSLLTAAASAYGMNPGQSNSQAQAAAGVNSFGQRGTISDYMQNSRMMDESGSGGIFDSQFNSGDAQTLAAAGFY